MLHVMKGIVSQLCKSVLSMQVCAPLRQSQECVVHQWHGNLIAERLGHDTQSETACAAC